MTEKVLCHSCHSNPCFLLCPMADPFQGDQQAENEDYEANAQYDSVSERFSALDNEQEAYYDFLDAALEAGESDESARLRWASLKQQRWESQRASRSW